MVGKGTLFGAHHTVISLSSSLSSIVGVGGLVVGASEVGRAVVVGFLVAAVVTTLEGAGVGGAGATVRGVGLEVLRRGVGARVLFLQCGCSLHSLHSVLSPFKHVFATMLQPHCGPREAHPQGELPRRTLSQIFVSPFFSFPAFSSFLSLQAQYFKMKNINKSPFSFPPTLPPSFSFSSSTLSP